MPERKDPAQRVGHPGSAIDPALSVSRAKSRRKNIPIPEPSPRWKPQARSWFNSLKLSGQAEFYEASDWATAVAAAEAYNVFLLTRNASIFANFVKLTQDLGATINPRKRTRIELVDEELADADEDAADAAVEGWHGRLRRIQ